MLLDSPSQWHVMAKPPVWQRPAMHRREWACPRRGADLLHATVLPLGTFADLGCDLDTLIAALAEVEAEPFLFVLDCARGRTDGTAELFGSKPAPAANRLRRAVRSSLERRGIPVACKSRMRPHVTLHYTWREPAFETAIEPIPWLIDTIVLVESLTGKTRHVEHGRFPIVPRQGMLFPLTPCSAARAHSAAGTPALAHR